MNAYGQFVLCLQLSIMDIYVLFFGLIESTPFYSNEHGDEHSPSDCCSINQTHPVTLNTLGAAIAASSSIPLLLFSSQYLIP